MSNPFPLSEADVATFAADGVVIVRGFYDLKAEILPIQQAIYEIIGLVIKRHGLAIECAPFHPDRFDSGFLELIRVNRRYGAEVYDAIKLIPAFVRLSASEKHEAVLHQLRGTALPGFISRGYGIRIDVPGEDEFRSLWHQEYLFQLRSRDGLTFWSPLARMTPDMGPVVFALGSHADGIRRVYSGDRNKPGAYSWTIEQEEQVVGQYPQVAPLSEPGDLIVLDFLVLHCSGFNKSTRPRWSMQMRMFNFLEPSGIASGWSGAVAEGVCVPQVVPQFFVPAPSAV